MKELVASDVIYIRSKDAADGGARERRRQREPSRRASSCRIPRTG